MNKNMKTILFANTRKFVIDEGSLGEPNNIVMAMTLNKNLEKYGFTLDANALKALATQTPAEMQKTWNELVYAVCTVTGADVFSKKKLFYPNFPEEVMRTPEAQLYLNSLFYYTFAQSNNELMDAIADELRLSMVEEAQERLPLIENFPRELKIINKGTEQDLMKMMNARMHSLNMSEQNFAELVEFSKVYHEEFDKMIASDEPFQSKESKVRIAMMLHGEGRDAEVAMMLKDTVDVLRYAAMLSKQNGIEWNNVELKPHNGKNIAFKLTNAEQKHVKSLLNNCKNLYTDIWRQEKLFKSLMNRIKPTVKAGCPERVVKAFDNLAANRKLDENGKPIFNFENERKKAVDTLNKTGNDKHLVSLATNFPGAFLKAYVATVRGTNEEHRMKVINAIKNCSASTAIALRDILTTQNAVLEGKKRQDSLVKGDAVTAIYTHHRDKQYVRVYSEPTKVVLSDDEFAAMHNALHETAVEMVKGYQALGNIYIDPALADRKAPGREMRDASGGATLVPHSIIKGDTNKNLILVGINWGQPVGSHDTHIDVDSSVHFYGENYEDKGHVSYASLLHEAAVHSGDYTHVPAGGTSTEAIVFDKKKMREYGIRYAVAEVHCYSIESFRKAGNCHFVMQQREGSFADVGYKYDRSKWNMTNSVAYRHQNHNGQVLFMGEVFEPSAAECNILLNSDACTVAPFMYDVKEDHFVWLDYSLSNAYDMIRPSTTFDPSKMSRLMVEIENAKTSKKPDMETLFRTFAESNGIIVDNIEEADTVFVADTVDAEKLNIREGARIITSFDLDIISKEFSGNNDLSKIQAQETQPVKEKVVKESPLVQALRQLKAKMKEYPNAIY